MLLLRTGAGATAALSPGVRRIGKVLVCFEELLELLLILVLSAVRVVLLGQPMKLRFDLFVARTRRHSQDSIVVTKLSRAEQAAEPANKQHNIIQQLRNTKHLDTSRLFLTADSFGGLMPPMGSEACTSLRYAVVGCLQTVNY